MAKQRRSLSGKVVAITGGARGIGKATATALVRKGCRVAIGDLDLALAEQTAAGLGGGTIALPLDVTDRASFAAFLDEAERQLGPLDVVDQQRRDHAGDAVRRGDRRLDPPPARHQPATASSSAPSWRSSGCARAAAATSSTSPRRPAKAGFPGIATYSATKHAVVGLSEAVRAELRGSGVEIACVMPTVVNTELTAGVGQRWVKPVEAEDVANEIVDALEVAALRRLRAARQRRPLQGRAPCCRAAPARRSAALMKVDKLMTEVDHGARRAYEERAAASEPSAGDDAGARRSATPPERACTPERRSAA